MGEIGLMGINVAEQYGGAELDALAYAISCEEISRGCASAGVILSAHNSLYISPIKTYGNHEQKLKYVAPFVTGKHHICSKGKKKSPQILSNFFLNLLISYKNIPKMSKMFQNCDCK